MMNSSGKRGLRRPSLLRALAAALLLASGSAEDRPAPDRERYRVMADREVEAILQGKAEAIDWTLAPGLLVPEAASRYADPWYPGTGPAPRDDEAAARLMRKVDGKPGAALWAQTGERSPVESGAWRHFLPEDAEGIVLLNLENSVRLALLHSRRFQTVREDLYLASLDVTEQRFRFRSQPFLRGFLENERAGRDRPGPADTLTSDALLGINRSLATGADVVAGLANTVLWDMTGNAETAISSVVNVSIVQPLLRFQARSFVLEALTQSERGLLANVRRMQQFHQGFYISTVTGVNLGEGPVRGRVPGATAQVVAGTPTGAFRAGGFLGLLQTRQQISNGEASVAALRDSLAQLQAAFDAGRINNRLQVDQARQALYNGQSGLLTSYAAFDSSVDAYKVSLGLPPDLPVGVRDPLLERFDLVDPTMSGLQNRVANLLDRTRNPTEIGTESALLGEMAKLGAMGEDVENQVMRARSDLAKLEAALPARSAQLRELAGRPELEGVSVDPDLFDPRGLEGLPERLAKELDLLEANLGGTLQNISALREVSVPEGQLERARRTLVGELTTLSGNLLQLSLIQAASRLESITLRPLSVGYEECLALAEHYRLDWMNARAALVDAWRGIAVEAEALKTGLDLIVRGEVPTIGNEAFTFDGDSGVLRLGVQLDSPFRRLVERNNYREALINYQDARRRYMLFEDVVKQSLRNTLRIVRLNQLNFEVRRAAVRVAIAQVDLARLRLNEPPKPGVAGAQFGATTARDLVSALGDLLDAQNDFLNVWVGFEVLRMLLDYELGTMRLDEGGMWVDPGDFQYEVPVRGGESDAVVPENGKLDAASDVIPKPGAGASGRKPLLSRPGFGRK